MGRQVLTRLISLFFYYQFNPKKNHMELLQFSFTACRDGYIVVIVYNEDPLTYKGN